LGGALGLSFAYYADAVFVRFFAIEIKVQPDPLVLSFSAAVCLLTGILFGLIPAVRVTRIDVSTPLKQTLGHNGRGRIDRWLLTSQVSFSLLLLTGATLFVRSLRNLRHLDAGFNREHVLLVPVDHPAFSGYEGQRIAELYKELLVNITALPGIRSATLVTDVPTGELSWFQAFTGTESRIMPLQVSVNHVGANFFETFGVPILEGRDFTGHDSETATKVIAISEAVARYYFPHDNPLGRATQLGTIVAVVKDVNYSGLRDSAPLVIYRPILQEPNSWGQITIAIRTRGETLRSTPPLIRRAIRKIDPTLPILNIITMSEKVDESLRQERLFAALTSVFGFLALVLVSIGLSGIIGYAVSRRVNEIGLRMALGAKRAHILWLVMANACWLVGSGLAIGLVLALAAGHWIASLLFGLSPVDPISLGWSSFLLLLSTALAGFVPAWRALRVDPAIALRFE